MILTKEEKHALEQLFIGEGAIQDGYSPHAFKSWWPFGNNNAPAIYHQLMCQDLCETDGDGFRLTKKAHKALRFGKYRRVSS